MRTSHSIGRGITSAFIIALLASCGEPTSPPSSTLDESLAEMSATLSAAGPALAMASSIPATGPGSSDDCEYQPAGHFQCPTRGTDGISVTRRYYLLDAAGAALSSWGPDVFAIRNVVDLTSSRTSVVGDSVVQFEQEVHDDATLSGLGTSTRTLEGLATATGTRTIGVNVQTIESTRMTDLVLGAPRTPPTGTITMETTLVEQGLTSSAILTFDGTSIHTLQIALGGGVVITCTFDMRTPHERPSCS